MSEVVTGPAGSMAPEEFDDEARGSAFWSTFFSAERTPTEAMSAGLMTLPAAGGWLAPHRHAQPELYFVASGSGTLTVDGRETALSAGMAAFIPGDAEHALRNRPSCLYSTCSRWIGSGRSSTASRPRPPAQSFR